MTGVPASRSGSRASHEAAAASSPEASIPNACDCAECKGACEHKPGWFKPEQIAPLAKALGITEQELFDQHLQVDWWDGDEATEWEDVFVLSPAVVGGDVGDMFDRDPKGTCAWFKDGKCVVHALGKPFECAAYHHTDNDAPKARHREVALAWNGAEHQQRIADLLGREPEATGSWSIFDQMGMGGMWS